MDPRSIHTKAKLQIQRIKQIIKSRMKENISTQCQFHEMLKDRNTFPKIFISQTWLRELSWTKEGGYLNSRPPMLLHRTQSSVDRPKALSSTRHQRKHLIRSLDTYSHHLEGLSALGVSLCNVSLEVGRRFSE